MLTLERVMEVFSDFLSEHEEYEVVKTKRGFVVLFWEEDSDYYQGADVLKTVEDLRDELIDCYKNELVLNLPYNLEGAKQMIEMNDIDSIFHTIIPIYVEKDDEIEIQNKLLTLMSKCSENDAPLI